MGYIAFARKYRPQVFDDIVGQSHITTTLKNAVSRNRSGHAYLFAGPRGVGKTTTARILAKALNCEKGPVANPCNLCASCKEITEGSSLDILEIDGASNRGIDEIRNLRENVKFAPSKGKFRIYIIDEVHMLTAEAFNALLKTLEEPPAHVKFIFATTQPHKVPATILSRCQKFDFRRIPTGDILASLKKIASAEAISVDDEVLGMIARHSDGSLRDGQVILDQMASSTQGKIGAEDASRMLGAVADDVLFGLSDSIDKKDSRKALEIIDGFMNEGRDASQLVSALIRHFRNISVAKIGSASSSLIDAEPEKLKRYRQIAENFGIEEILYVIYTLSNTIDFIRKSNLSRIPLEAAMVKLTTGSTVMSLKQILDRLDRLENSADESVRGGVSGASHATQSDAPSAVKQPPLSEKPVKTENGTITEHAEKAAVTEAAEKFAVKTNTAALDDILGSWTGIVNHIRGKKISIASYLQEGYPIAAESRTLTIGFPNELGFYKEVLESPENKRLIGEAMKEVLGSDFKIAFVLTEVANSKNNHHLRQPEKDGTGKPSDAEEGETRSMDPIVKTALDIFGGEVAE